MNPNLISFAYRGLPEEMAQVQDRFWVKGEAAEGLSLLKAAIK